MSAALANPGLTFDAAQHRYAFNGATLVSVTQAIGAAGLIESEWYTDFARERGRLVHLATQFDDEGDLDEESLSPVIRPYVEAYRKFKAECRFVPQLIESRFGIIDCAYAGTVDRVGLLDGRKAVLDLKSGEICPWIRLQLAGYANSLPNGAIYERYGVQLKSDGTYKLVSFPVRDFRRDLSDFLVCVRTHQLQEEMGCRH